MLYCFDNKLNFDYSKREMALSKINNNGIFYDPTLKKFLDYDGNEVDIKGQLVFPRTGYSQIYDMNDEIIKHGGYPILMNKEIDMVISWPKYFKTVRKMQMMRGRDLINPAIVDEIEENYGDEIFFKTREKDFHDMISIDLLKDPDCAFYKTILHHLEDEFMISEGIDVVNDNYGIKEYRCFVVNKELMNISRMTVNVFHSIEQNVFNKAMEVIERLDDSFPKSYSFDLLEYEKDGERIIDVCEFNPIHAAGLYLYNSVMSKSEDVLHLDTKKISYEFADMIDECIFEGDVINSRENDFDRSNTFSNDLRSICVQGDIGLQYTTLYINAFDYSRHNGILDDFQEISCDEELFNKANQFLLSKDS